MRLSWEYACVLQVGTVMLVTWQWTRSATGSLTVNWRGTMQVTSVWLMENRWLFSPTWDVRLTTVNWPTGWAQRTRHIGLDLQKHGGRRLMTVITAQLYFIIIFILEFVLRGCVGKGALDGDRTHYYYYYYYYLPSVSIPKGGFKNWGAWIAEAM